MLVMAQHTKWNTPLMQAKMLQLKDINNIQRPLSCPVDSLAEILFDMTSHHIAVVKPKLLRSFGTQ